MSVQILAGVAGIALVAGVILTQWRMMRQSDAMRQRIESAVDAKFASGTRPPSHPPAQAVVVARARDETALAWAVSFGLVASLAIGNFAVRSGGMISLVLGGAAAVGCVALIRTATRRPVRFSASVDGFTAGSGGRFVPWNEVREISLGYPQAVYAEERSLILRMHLDPSVVGDCIGSNTTNTPEIDVPLDGLSPRWQEIVAIVSAVSGRPLRSMHERAFPLTQPTDRVGRPSSGCPERGRAPEIRGNSWTSKDLASLWMREPMGMLHRELSWWRRRRRTGFSDSLVHEVVVPAGPDGRPGERVLATSSSVYGSTHIPRLASDASRSDFIVIVGRHSTVAAVCLGPVCERGEPRERAIRASASLSAWSGTDCTAFADDTVAGQRAVRYRVIRPDGVMTEWQFTRDGWAFVVGVHCRYGDHEADVLRLGGRVLSTWRWIEHESPEGSATEPPRRDADS